MQCEFSSFRDPSGAVFRHNGEIYRQVNQAYRPQFDQLTNSGFFAKLMAAGMLVRHTVVTDVEKISEEAYCILKPEVIPMVSYPYEWTFLQLKDAALLTLRLHREALDHGFIMKDASAYNIQFLQGRPIMIDTLSFDGYQEGMPWVAYGQFCRHFLAPLLLMCYTDVRLNTLLRDYIDGVPLDLAARLLNGRGGFFAKQHIVWHAASIRKHTQDGRQTDKKPVLKLSKASQMAMVDAMIRGVEKLAMKDVCTEWADYYAHTNYTPQGTEHKSALIRSLLEKITPRTLWDIGANDGTYSRLALKAGASVVALDIDPAAVMRNYVYVNKERLNMLPLIFDFCNPSPAIGFANQERLTLTERQHPDCVIALAVIHHMAISNNLPLPKIAAWLASMTQHLVIEFVPKTDSQCQILLASRDDIFPRYTQEGFEQAFAQEFTLREKVDIADSQRTLYWFERK